MQNKPISKLFSIPLLPRLLFRPVFHVVQASYRLLTLVSMAAVLGGGLPGDAEIRLPHAISDHAVLQREAPIRIWGWTEPGARLKVSLHGQHIAATADRTGEWVAWLMPEAAGGPYTLTVEGESEPRVTVSDLLIGDVWVASGQSNMEMPLLGFPPGAFVKDSAKEIAAADHPRMRLLHVPQKSSDFPLDDQPAVWTACTPQTAGSFSAVAYFFGREISEREHVPIGLIESAWGGTPADSWVSMETLGSDANLQPAFASRARFAEHLARTTEIAAAESREDAEAKAAGRTPAPHGWHPVEGSWSPAGLYNGMIAPLARYSVKGILWYQGETNSAPDRAPFYESLFRALILDWRARFQQGDLPFLYAQISSFRSPGEDWGLVRDSQRRALALRGTGMAVTLDVGTPENVHPPDKQTVSARLALAARAVVYGEQVAYTGPLFRQATTEPEGLRVWFDQSEGLTSSGKAVTGFEVAGEDHQFVPAAARLDHGTVVVTSATLAHPRFVRYGWSGVVDQSLYNGSGLPMSTFTSEAQPVR